MYEVVVESSRPMIEVLSPLDGAVVGSVPDASKADAAVTASALRTGQPEWEALGTRPRSIQTRR
jgi:acyl-CoA reductase-like NAD-dependent aldehyde dehydrogenase